MKQLTLIRHAKSSWKMADLEDSWRPLNRRGYRQLLALGKRIPASGLWLVSPAVRTYTTAHVLRRLVGLPMCGLQLDERLYDSSGHQLLQLLQRLSEVNDAVVLVAHSPGLEELLTLLCPAHKADFGTADLVTLALLVPSWADCQAGSGQLLAHVSPAEAESI